MAIARAIITKKDMVMKKSPYTRSTAEIRFQDLHPKFIGYLRSYAELHKLGEIEQDVRSCFVTTNRKKGLLGGVQTDFTVVCMTGRFLFWGIISDKKETGVAAAQWSEISEIRDWKDSSMGAVMEDQGVEILGFIYQDSKRGFWFIGLDNEPAGMKCRALLQEMIAAKK